MHKLFSVSTFKVGVRGFKPVTNLPQNFKSIPLIRYCSTQTQETNTNTNEAKPNDPQTQKIGKNNQK